MGNDGYKYIYSQLLLFNNIDPPTGKTATDVSLSCNKPTVREKSVEESENLLLVSLCNIYNHK